jgi:deoxycytidine triphosphate deaminase
MSSTDDPEQGGDWPHFALTQDEARERATEHESDDPLRSVPCGLLSSAEIDDYVRNTGMIFPYDRNSLKTASYEMHLGGRFIYWDEHGQKHDELIDRRKQRYVILPPNSITFVQVEPHFRLPNYIAIRFNLRITHVHRGLLLGTGPLVDPGFHGELLIPLHNLTAFEYYLDTDKALIWVEFTKTAFGFWPGEGTASRSRHFVPFPPEKRDLSADEYLFKARGGQPIVSSIPGAIESARNAATDAAATARSVGKWVQGFGFVAVLGVVIGLTSIVFSSWSVLQNANALAVAASTIAKDQGIAGEKLDAARKEFERIESDAKMTRERIEMIEERVTDQRSDINVVASAQRELAQLRIEIDQLKAELMRIQAIQPPASRPKNR